MHKETELEISIEQAIISLQQGDNSHITTHEIVFESKGSL